MTSFGSRMYLQRQISVSLKFTVYLLYLPEANLELRQTSMMQRFAKIVNGLTPLLLKSSSVIDVQLGSKYASFNFYPIYIKMGLYYGTY